jgi:hypothetical protein
VRKQALHLPCACRQIMSKSSQVKSRQVVCTSHALAAKPFAPRPFADAPRANTSAIDGAPTPRSSAAAAVLVPGMSSPGMGGGT